MEGFDPKSNGRLVDVLIFDKITNEITFEVYADEGWEKKIKDLPGVLKCFCPVKNLYYIQTDPRYHTEIVKESVRALILKGDPNEQYLLPAELGQRIGELVELYVTSRAFRSDHRSNPEESGTDEQGSALAQ